MRERESAICLRTADYSETSQVLHFFTRGWGAVRLLAKGSKRKKSASGGTVDLMSEGDLVFIASSRQTLSTLVEFTETVSHVDLRTDAVRLNAALLMIELVGEMLPEADPHPEVFDLLHNGLARLGQPDAPVPAVLAYFQWRMLKHVGLLGELDRCVACGRGVVAPHRRGAGDVYFSSLEGGLICGGCESALTEKYHLDGATLAGLAALAAAGAGRKVSLPDKQAHGVSRLLAYHATQQLGKPLKMARHAIPPP
ncbi:MAG TPA: DNA repair protein RecO [Phycisphaerae bacterium]|nr:DNA repair protein RecO [Phycisphaerae bacterium]